jgi:hypothetical protein
MAQQTKETFLLLPTGTVYRGTCKQDYRVCVQMNDRNSIAEKRVYTKKQYFCEWRWYPISPPKGGAIHPRFENAGLSGSFSVTAPYANNTTLLPEIIACMTDISLIKNYMMLIM